MSLSLQQFTEDLALGLQAADDKRPTYRSYQPGIGPHAEDAALRLAVGEMGEASPERYEEARSRSYPEASRKECDLVIPGQWAIEVKLARQFRDNGDESPHWIESVLYPYPDNKSMVGDCLKVGASEFEERRAVVAIGYEHDPPEIEVDTAMNAFETVAEEVQDVNLGPQGGATELTGSCIRYMSKSLSTGGRSSLAFSNCFRRARLHSAFLPPAILSEDFLGRGQAERGQVGLACVSSRH